MIFERTELEKVFYILENSHQNMPITNIAQSVRVNYADSNFFRNVQCKCPSEYPFLMWNGYGTKF
jgi:hypothetical protein